MKLLQRDFERTGSASGRAFPFSPRTALVLAFLWLATVAASLAWNLARCHESVLTTARQEAAALWATDDAYWRLLHGRASIAFSLPSKGQSELDAMRLRHWKVTLEDGTRLGLAESATLGRFIHESIGQLAGYMVHRTSLRSRRGKGPDEWERNALTEFEQGRSEQIEQVQLDGKPYLRLMRPLIAEERCMKCHSVRVGDVVGGVSVSVPLDKIWAATENTRVGIWISHGLAAFLGCVVIVLFSWIDQRRTALLSATQEYVTLSENLPLGCFRLHDRAELPIAMCNSAMASMLGYSADREIVGTSFLEFFAEPQEARHFAKQLQQTERFAEEYQMRRHDGSIFFAHVTLRIVRKSSRAGRYIDGLIEDVTERRRREEQLRILSTVVEQSPSLVIITDREGRIQYVNPKFSEQTGYRPEEVYGKNPRILKSGRMSREVFTDLWRTITSGRVWRGDLLNRKKNGKLFWESATISPIFDEQGAITHFVAVKEDITQRKRTEAKMAKLNQRLIEVSRRAGMAEVATDVLHNVGNVLTSVKVSSQLLAEKLQRYPLRDLERLAELIDQHAGNLAEFLSQDGRAQHFVTFMQELSQVMRSEQKLMLEELGSLEKNIHHISQIVAQQQSRAGLVAVEERTPLPEVLEHAVMINAASLERHNIEVVREWEDLPDVIIDRHRLLQILINLISNAKSAIRDSGQAGGRIIVRLKRKGQDRVIIEVEDNGKGIEPENLTRIFAHGFTTRADGRGFGLHGAALHAKQLGGSLAAHSDGPGRGACFVLDLPFRPAESETHGGSRPTVCGEASK